MRIKPKRANADPGLRDARMPETEERPGVCAECGEPGCVKIIQARGIYMCKACALKLYKRLGVIFVPRSLPNVVLKSVAAANEAAKPLG